MKVRWVELRTFRLYAIGVLIDVIMEYNLFFFLIKIIVIYVRINK